MTCVSYGVLAAWSIGLFLLGLCVGAFIIYRIEETNFKVMTAQCESLAAEEQKLHREREEFNNQKLFETIDDLPEYLRGKYDISEKQTFTDSDEDVSEIYI